MSKDIDEIKKDTTHRRGNGKADRELMSYLEKISKCPYCPARFTGTPSEKERARIKHIKKKHPGSPFIRG